MSDGGVRAQELGGGRLLLDLGFRGHAGLIFGAIAALTGFLAHELAHKVSAERAGFWAEFRMSPMGLLVSLATAFLGFLLAAPGATVVSGMSDARQWGRTSLAGPVVNLVEGAAFAIGALAVAHVAASATYWIDSLWLLAFFNGWFATFNLIPLGPLDGRKVLRWSSGVWIVAFAVSAVFTVAAFVTFSILP